jgi:hypothetical protein
VLSASSLLIRRTLPPIANRSLAVLKLLHLRRNR